MVMNPGKIFLNLKIVATVKMHPLCTFGWRSLCDITRRLFIKFYGEAILSAHIDHGERLHQSILGPPPALARPRDKVGIG